MVREPPSSSGPGRRPFKAVAKFTSALGLRVFALFQDTSGHTAKPLDALGRPRVAMPWSTPGSVGNRLAQHRCLPPCTRGRGRWPTRRYDNWPVYEMVYVALAERLGHRLVTADRRLVTRLGHLDWIGGSRGRSGGFVTGRPGDTQTARSERTRHHRCATSITSRDPLPGPSRMNTRNGSRARTPRPMVV